MPSYHFIFVLSSLVPTIRSFQGLHRREQVNNHHFSNTSHVESQNQTDDNKQHVPGLWSSYCASDFVWPCTAFCDPGNPACISAARSIVDTCGPSWSSFSSVQNGLKPPGPLWRNVTSTIGLEGGPVTTTIDVYTSFSTASTGFGRWQSNHVTPTTITPVYALGSPSPEVTVTTLPEYLTPDTITVLTGPTPSCKFESLSVVTSSECGRCTLTGGTVDLYFWPPEQATVSGSMVSHAPGQVRSAVLNGTTLFSPTVYIAIRTIYASNSCLQVGDRHTGTLIAMDPDQVSTQIDIGLKQPAYRYGQLNYTDLLNPPPAWQYEMQPSCYVFGCPTIYNTRWFPTLRVPSQVRTIDPAWASCGLALEGFYDPPVALTARKAQVTMTMSKDPGKQTPYPCKTPDTQQPRVTWSIQSSESSRTDPRHSVDTVFSAIQSVLSGEPSQTPSPMTSHESPKAPAETHASSPESRSAPHPQHPTVARNTEAGGSPTATSIVTSTTDGIETQNDSKHRTAGKATEIKPTPNESPGTFVSESSQSGDPHRSPSTENAISKNSMTQYVINGKTLAPSSPVTITGEEGPVTLRMVTSKSRTLIALGTTTTLDFGPNRPSPTSPLAFTRASNGDFVLHGTTLASGDPITIGSEGERTTLRLTTVSSMPAIVINGNTTGLLGYNTSLVRLDSSNSITLPVITQLSTSAATSRATATSHATASHSGAGDFSGKTLSWPGVILPIALGWMVS